MGDIYVKDFELSLGAIQVDNDVRSRDVLMPKYFDAIDDARQCIEDHIVDWADRGYKLWVSTISRWNGEKYTLVENRDGK